MAETLAIKDPVVEGAVRRAMWRLLPFLGLCYLLNYVDRVNVGFSSLTMNSDLGLSAAAYGLGDLSGFAGPYLTGWLQDLTGSFRAGMFVVAGFMVLAGVIVLFVGRDSRAAVDTRDATTAQAQRG